MCWIHPQHVSFQFCIDKPSSFQYWCWISLDTFWNRVVLCIKFANFEGFMSTNVRKLLAWVQSLYTVLYNKHIHNFFIHSCKTIVHNNEGELTYTHKVFQILSTWYQCINITPLNINFKRIPRIFSPRWWSVWWKERWCQLTRTTHTWISYIPWIHTTTCWTE